MTPQQFVTLAIIPGLSLLPAAMNSPEAQCQLIATAAQESGLVARVQVPGGQARSLFQCERSGGITGVMTGPMRLYAIAACSILGIPSDIISVFAAIAWNDSLAVVIARLILWMDPLRLPALGNETSSWNCYCRTWQPGIERPADWPAAYAAAMSVA